MKESDARTHAQCPGVICFETAKELKFPSLDVARPKAVYDQSHRVSTNHLSHFLFRCQIEARPLVHERPGTKPRHALPAGVSNGPDNKYVLDHLFFLIRFWRTWVCLLHPEDFSFSLAAE